MSRLDTPPDSRSDRLAIAMPDTPNRRVPHQRVPRLREFEREFESVVGGEVEEKVRFWIRLNSDFGAMDCQLPEHPTTQRVRSIRYSIGQRYTRPIDFSDPRILDWRTQQCASSDTYSTHPQDLILSCIATNNFVGEKLLDTMQTIDLLTSSPHHFDAKISSRSRYSRRHLS